MEINELIIKAKDGDRESFGKIYKVYYSKIYRYCVINVKRIDLAEEITQDVFLKAWKSLSKFRITKTGTFQAFLYQIARNTIIDLSRKTKEVSLEGYDFEDLGKDTESSLLREEDIRLVQKALSKLEDIDRQIIVLRYFEELSHKEISAITGIKEGALRVRTIRLLEKLRKIII